MNNFNSKHVFGEMKIDSDNLKAVQIAKIKFLPAVLDGLKELKPKLCIEQRLDGQNGLSAPMSLRFQDYDQLRIFVNDMLIPAMLFFAEVSGKDLDWAAHDLKIGIYHAVDRARRERVVGVV